jgi:uncharacterized OB-fold protein
VNDPAANLGPLAADGSGVRLSDADLTAEFWDGCARGELLRPVCDDCDRSFFTPRVACPYCTSSSWRYRASIGRGVVYSHTTVHRGPDRDWEVPYVLGIVDVDEGWSLLTRLLVDDPEPDGAGALIGAPVVVRFIASPDPSHTRLMPAFALEGPTS